MTERLLVLQEYQRLFASDPRLGAGEFERLEKFALDYQGRHKKTVLELGTSGGERYVKATHYVGLLTLPSGLRLEILPKLSLAAEPGESWEEETRERFFDMLQTCGVIPRAPSARSGLGHRHTDMLECFYAAFVESVQKLVRQGLAAGYHSHTENQPFLKGRLELAGHIKYNAAHRERFYVTYDVFDRDRAENRLVKTALVGVRKKTLSQALRSQADRLLGDMDAIPLSPAPAVEFGRLVRDRSVARYGEALEWARLFLLHESFTTFSGSAATQAVLFPMERVFEEHVAIRLRRALAPQGWTVSAQDRSHWLFWDERDRKGWFRLKPDIVLTYGRGGNRRSFVMDTKWKRLDSRSRNAGMSQADFYQMYAYGKKYVTRRVTLLYPWSDGQSYRFTSGEEESPVTVEVKQLHVDRIEEELVPYVLGLLRE